MSASKKVDFIESVAKSYLGLEGLQIVVYCDKNRIGKTDLLSKTKDEYNFVDIGNKMLSQIDGEYIKKKYSIKDGIEFGNRLHEERVKWMKKTENNLSI